MGRLIRVLTVAETFGRPPICGAMGGEPSPSAPVCPPPPPPPPPSCPPPPPSPSAEPHLVGTPLGAIAGSLWVEGSELHYLSAAGTEYAGTGTSIATRPTAIAGSFWAEGEALRYIDATGIERELPKTSLGAKAGAALAGSLWIESTATAGQQLQWVSGATRYTFWNGTP